MVEDLSQKVVLKSQYLKINSSIFYFSASTSARNTDDFQQFHTYFKQTNPATEATNRPIEGDRKFNVIIHGIDECSKGTLI